LQRMLERKRRTYDVEKMISKEEKVLRDRDEAYGNKMREHYFKHFATVGGGREEVVDHRVKSGSLETSDRTDVDKDEGEGSFLSQFLHQMNNFIVYDHDPNMPQKKAATTEYDNFLEQVELFIIGFIKGSTGEFSGGQSPVSS